MRREYVTIGLWIIYGLLSFMAGKTGAIMFTPIIAAAGFCAAWRMVNESY